MALCAVPKAPATREFNLDENDDGSLILTGDGRKYMEKTVYNDS